MIAEHAVARLGRALDLSVREGGSRLADVAPSTRELALVLLEPTNILPVHAILSCLCRPPSTCAFFCAIDTAVDLLVKARLHSLEQQSAGRRQRRRPELQPQVRLALLVIGVLKGLKALGRVPPNLVT